MTLTQKTAHVVEDKARLASPFSGKPRLEALVGVFAKRIQDFENTIFEIIDETTIDAAVGTVLDGIGNIVGQLRRGQSDIDYRQSIKSRILLNTASATPEDIIALVESVVGVAKTVVITEFFPASFEAEVTEALDLDTDGVVVGRFVQEGKPAGVGAVFRFHTTDTPFTYSSSASPEIDAALGLGDTGNSATGGDFAGAFGDGGGS